MGLQARIRPVRAAADAVPYSKERRDAAIKSGGIPLDCQPDYLPFLFKGFVDLDNPLPRLLCELFPERREWYTDAWCRLAQTDAIAWDETWRWIYGLVAAGLDVPDRLRRFAFVPRPHRGRGRTSKEAWSLRFEYLVAALVDEGFDEGSCGICTRNAFRTSSRRIRAIRIARCAGSEAPGWPVRIPARPRLIRVLEAGHPLFTRRRICPRMGTGPIASRRPDRCSRATVRRSFSPGISGVSDAPRILSSGACSRRNGGVPGCGTVFVNC